MEKANEQLRKEMEQSLLESKEKLMASTTADILKNIDINKYIKKGKLNTNGLVSKIRSDLAKAMRSIDRIK